MARRKRNRKKQDITKRPRRAMSADERRELFREFKLGLFALAALVVLVVTLCWDRGGSTKEPAAAKGAAKSGPKLVRVVWQPRAVRGGRPSAPKPKAGPVKAAEPRAPERRREPPAPRRREPPPPPEPRYRNYEVRKNDTLWKIAKRQLGDGRLWTLIRDHNPALRNPHRLKCGAVLRIPLSLGASGAGRLAEAGPGGGAGRLLHSQTADR